MSRGEKPKPPPFAVLTSLPEPGQVEAETRELASTMVNIARRIAKRKRESA